MSSEIKTNSIKIINGVETAGAKSNLSNLTSPTAINQSLLFGLDQTYNIGSDSFRVFNIFPSVVNLLQGSAGAPSLTFQAHENEGIYMNGGAPSIIFAFNGTDFFTVDHTTGDNKITLVSGAYRSPNGSAASPTYSFSGDTDNGLFLSTTNTIALSAGGTARLTLNTTTLSSAVDILPSTDNARKVGSNTLRFSELNSRRAKIYNGTSGDAGIVWDITTINSTTPSGESINLAMHTFAATQVNVGMYTEGNLSAVNGGNFFLETGTNISTSGSFNSGLIKRKTGALTNAGNAGASGSLSDLTGDVAGGGASGSALRQTGNSAGGNSGDISDIAGTAGGIRGKILHSARVVDQSTVEEGTILANLAADPASNVAGTIYYDTNTGKFRGYNDVDAQWEEVGSSVWAVTGDDLVMSTPGIPLLSDGIRAVSVIDSKRSLVWFSDFFAAAETAFWNTSLAGTNTTSAYHSLFLSPTECGVWMDATGIDVTGRVRHYTSSSIMLGAATTRFITKVRPETEATVGEDYKWFFGLGNTFADDTDFTNGVYFKYNRSVSTNWLLGRVSAGVSTEDDSGIPVDDSVFVVLEFVVDSTAGSVEYFIDGSSAGSFSDNIPSSSSALNGVTKLIKTNGDDERRVIYDYIGLRMDWATNR